MKKKLLVATVAACLAAVTLVSGTLAYFQDSTREVVNTFTVGNVHIDLLEPEWKTENGQNLEPGEVVKKNPYIMNTGKNAGYMMMHVEGMDRMATQGFEVKYNSKEWDLVDAQGKALKAKRKDFLQDGYYVYNVGPVASQKMTSTLFDEVKFAEDAKELNSSKYKIMGYFEDENGLFSYEDENGKAINSDRQPTVFKDKKPVVVYQINGVDHEPFSSIAEAEKYILENVSNQEISFKFDLTLQGFAIQTEKDENGKDIGHKNYTKWVPELTGQSQNKPQA